ncbi:MAG TPA: SnoaL-like domain-containing protein [Puia sp.]
MTTPQIATRLVELCRQGQYENAQKELYANDAISIEPQASPDFAKETKGLPAIIEKGHKFEAMTEKVYATTASDPLIVGNTIAFTHGIDIAMKGTKRSKMEELCVYQVKEGKIVSEQFFM